MPTENFTRKARPLSLNLKPSDFIPTKFKTHFESSVSNFEHPKTTKAPLNPNLRGHIVKHMKDSKWRTRIGFK